MRFGWVLGLVVGAAIVAGCSNVETAQPASLRGKSCDELTDQRRQVGRDRAAMDDPDATPPTAYGAFLEVFGARKGPTAKGTSEAMANERAKVIAALDANRAALDRAIEEKQCTATSRAKASGARIFQGRQYDGRYAGQASTESWCTAPGLSLTLEAGAFSGTLTDGATNYRVRGSLYENLEASLVFARDGTGAFGEEADGVLKDDTLSLLAKLDTSAKGCTWRFALKRQ